MSHYKYISYKRPDISYIITSSALPMPLQFNALNGIKKSVTLHFIIEHDNMGKNTVLAYLCDTIRSLTMPTEPAHHLH